MEEAEDSYDDEEDIGSELEDTLDVNDINRDFHDDDKSNHDRKHNDGNSKDDDDDKLSSEKDDSKDSAPSV